MVEVYIWGKAAGGKSRSSGSLVVLVMVVVVESQLRFASVIHALLWDPP